MRLNVMARSSIYKNVYGVEAMTGALRAISDGMRSEVLEAGVRAASRPILIAMKTYAKRSEDTGALRASLTIKTVNYKANGKVVGMIGPDKAYFHGKKKATGLARALLKTSRPAWYAHLVEQGHKVVAPKKGTSIRKGTAQPAKSGKTWVPAKPFIRPAVLTTHSQQSSAFYEGIKKGYDKILSRHTKG
jgi:hypothetical protein